MEWWQKAGLLSGLSVAFLGFVAQLFANDLAVPSKIVLMVIGIGTISAIFVLSWPPQSQRGNFDSNLSARLFFLPPYFFFPFSLFRAPKHAPHDKVVLNYDTKKAYYVGEYVMQFIQNHRIEWISEPKPFRHWIGLEEWCRREGFALVHKEANQDDLGWGATNAVIFTDTDVDFNKH